MRVRVRANLRGRECGWVPNLRTHTRYVRRPSLQSACIEAKCYSPSQKLCLRSPCVRARHAHAHGEIFPQHIDVIGRVTRWSFSSSDDHSLLLIAWSLAVDHVASYFGWYEVLQWIHVIRLGCTARVGATALKLRTGAGESDSSFQNRGQKVEDLEWGA